MKSLDIPYDARVIVGMETGDDAGVYRLTEDIALIQTVDFFTPIVDDPFVFGQIAVANGLSDVYAMGGRPLTALNIIAFPLQKFSLEVMGRIMDGGLSILKKAGVQLLGGHSVEDEELKYGVAVTGLVHPDRVLKNRGLRDGDVLVFTKPLGTGIIGTVLKGGPIDSLIYDPFVNSMVTLNAAAAEAAVKYDIHACTDVTGFGLMGHLKEMLAGDPLSVMVESSKLPVLPGALEYAAMGMIPGGLYRNRDHVGGLCDVSPGVKREIADLVFDPQTSGGLLLSLTPPEAALLVEDLHRTGCTYAGIIGKVERSAKQKLILV